MVPRLHISTNPAFFHAQNKSLSGLKDFTKEEHSLLLDAISSSSQKLSNAGPRTVDRLYTYDWYMMTHRWRRRNRDGKLNMSSPPKPSASLLDIAKDILRGQKLKAHLWSLSVDRNVDAVTFFGIKRKNWVLADAILNSLIDTHEMLLPFMTPKTFTQGFDWGGKNTSLSALTNPIFPGRTDNGSIQWGDGIFNPVKPLPSNSNLALDTSTSKPVARHLAESFLAQTLFSLGMVVLTAAAQPLSESRVAMSYVYRALARLHHLDLLSDKIYQETTNTIANQEVSRPPWLYLLSNHIMTVLSDAAWLEHQAELANAATTAGNESPFVSFNVGVRELGPEIWFEYILWCCVEHGFAKQGNTLVHRMLKQDPCWKTESWEPLMRNINIVRQTNINKEQSWRRPGATNPPEILKDSPEKPAFNGLGERTISSEVISHLRFSLPNQSFNGLGFQGLTPDRMLRYIKPLDEAIGDKPGNELRPTKASTTQLVFRLLESGYIEPGTDRGALEDIIRYCQNCIPPWHVNTPLVPTHLDSIPKSQLRDETSAIVGLSEYSVRIHSEQGQASRAFSEYSRLQNIIDASKAHHITSFFEKLSQAPSADVPFFNSGKLDASSIPESSVPQVSIITLAGLLDLATAGNFLSIGNSLIFDNKVENPPIPPSVYNNQALLPSLLRFAGATKNNELCSEVLQSLNLPLSVNSLKALLNHYIDAEDWDRVVMITEYTRDFRSKAWGYSNIMALAAKIVRLEHSTRKVGDVGEPSEGMRAKLTNLARAKDIFFRFFASEFNLPSISVSRQLDVLEHQQKILQRLHIFFSSLNNPIGDITRPIKLKKRYPARYSLPYIPPKSFGVFLRAIVDTSGSYQGYLICVRWCLNNAHPSFWRRRSTGSLRLLVRDEQDNAYMNPEYSPKWEQARREKAVEADIGTIRILAQAARAEFEQAGGLTKRRRRQNPQTSTVSNSRPANLPPYQQRLWPQSADPSPVALESPDSGYKLDVPASQLAHQSKEGGMAPRMKAELVLDYCVAVFIRLGLSEEQIEFEIPGYSSYLRYRGVLTKRAAKRVRDRTKEIQNSPWMDAYVEDSLRAGSP